MICRYCENQNPALFHTDINGLRCKACGEYIPPEDTDLRQKPKAVSCNTVQGEWAVETSGPHESSPEIRVAGDSDVSDLMEELFYATVLVTIHDKKGRIGKGTGFFTKYQRNTYLITAYHVVTAAVNENAAIAIQFHPNVNPSEDFYHARVIAYDEGNDLAMLALSIPYPKTLKPFPLASARSIRPGEQVVTVGCPRMLSFNCSVGTVSNVSFDMKNDRSMKHFLCSIPIAPGNSGSAMVRTRDSAVVGVCVQVFDQEYLPLQTICAPSDAIAQMIALHEGRRTFDKIIKLP